MKSVNKDDVIRYVLEENGIGEEEKKSVIMVGDRKHDVEGAKKTGLSVVGVFTDTAAGKSFRMPGQIISVKLQERLQSC